MCNIGPAERRRRRASGIAAAVAGVVMLVALLLLDAPLLWRLVLVIPFFGAATGFLQDAFHFCAGFGLKGIYNVINSAGMTDNVELEEFRLKDRRKAQLILWLSLAIGAAATGLALLI